VGLVALADFGSTYTKVRLVDPGEGRLAGAGEAPTSSGTDLMEGYEAALAAALLSAGPGAAAIDHRLAVSSAGGGLRVAAVGLVADLTAAAAKQAALNAGARVEAVLSGVLGEEELDRLQAARPEIVLFAGGTDGGQAELVLENARCLGERGIGGHAVVACNAEVAEEVAAILRVTGTDAVLADNVMPELGRLEVASAREGILRVFLDHVIGGKGLSASPEFERMVRLPTPEAVFEATRLLDDVIVLDVGGATTDVHSSRSAEVAAPGIEDPLLPPPLALRTVEGDLGLRAGAEGVLAADRAWIEAEAGAEAAAIRQGVSMRSNKPRWLPDSSQEEELEALLAIACGTQALRRHCGTMLLARGEKGPPTLVRDGPDLREVALFVGTGGVFAQREDAEAILRRVLERRAPRSLAPEEPTVRVDHSYVMAAAGLLATEDPAAAERLLRRELGLSKNSTR
jgi:uncharacterized protein (TIGR01319 family)